MESGHSPDAPGGIEPFGPRLSGQHPEKGETQTCTWMRGRGAATREEGGHRVSTRDGGSRGKYTTREGREGGLRSASRLSDRRHVE